MKKILLLLATAASVGGVQAQQKVAPAQSVKRTHGLAEMRSVYGAIPGGVSNKAAATSDTGSFTLSVFLPQGYSNNYTREIFDTSVAYRMDNAAPADSGYVLGTNAYMDRGFAEQMHFRYKADTGLQILGFRALFAGMVNPASTRQVTFGLWGRAAETPVAGTTGQFNSGLPGAMLASMAVPVTQLGIGNANPDTIKNHFLATPHVLAAADSDFFVGYTMPMYAWSSMAGDTFSLRSSRDGYSFGVGSYLRNTTDTVHRNQNVYMNDAGVWGDIYWELNLDANLSIVPIVQLTGSLGVDKYFTAKDLTFFGNYPNPATEKTHIRFALESATGVTLTISDLNGRTLRTIPAVQYAAGTHEIPVNVSDLAAGNYIYTITTGKGGAVASQLSVVR